MLIYIFVDFFCLLLNNNGREISPFNQIKYM